MFQIELVHPIHTLDGRELVPAGKLLTAETVRQVIASNSGPPAKKIALMQLTPVKQEISGFLSIPPYNVIFASRKDTVEVLQILEQLKVITPVLEALEFFREHDFHTYRHSLMVFALATLVARQMVADRQKRLHHAQDGPSHDLGKICVPLDILMKTDPLTRQERNILFQHSLAGYVLLCYYSKNIDNFSAKVARDHHEHCDGSGFMRGVRLADPMVEIVAVCDIYDALLSSRPFRPVSFDNRSALEELLAMAQRGQVSWNVVQVLVSLNRHDKPDYLGARISNEIRGTTPAENRYGRTAGD